ncbi:chemotaxis protein CheD [Thiovibrio sp. JS02]
MIPDESYRKIFLKPGEICIADAPCFVWTTLGSCLSVVFFSPRLKLGAICHAQLPFRGRNGSRCWDACPVKCMQDAPSSCDFKYVNCAVNHMLDEFLRRGVARQELVVKIFGGANVLRIFDGNQSVGERNAAEALNLLASKNIPVTAKDVGGENGRTLGFYSDTGQVILKITPKSADF